MSLRKCLGRMLDKPELSCGKVCRRSFFHEKLSQEWLLPCWNTIIFPLEWPFLLQEKKLETQYTFGFYQESGDSPGANQMSVYGPLLPEHGWTPVFTKQGIDGLKGSVFRKTKSCLIVCNFLCFYPLRKIQKQQQWYKSLCSHQSHVYKQQTSHHCWDFSRSEEPWVAPGVNIWIILPGSEKGILDRGQACWDCT